MKAALRILANVVAVALLLALAYGCARQDYETFTHKYPQATFTDWAWDTLNGR
jgi:hypothetical protein